MDTRLCGLGVFEYVGQRFLHRQKEVVPHLRGKRVFGKAVGHLQVTLNARVLEELARVLANIRREIVQGVVLRADRPNDLLQATQHFASGLGDAIYFDRRLFGSTISRLARPLRNEIFVSLAPISSCIS